MIVPGCLAGSGCEYDVRTFNVSVCNHMGVTLSFFKGVLLSLNDKGGQTVTKGRGRTGRTNCYKRGRGVRGGQTVTKGKRYVYLYIFIFIYLLIYIFICYLFIYYADTMWYSEV